MVDVMDNFLVEVMALQMDMRVVEQTVDAKVGP